MRKRYWATIISMFIFCVSGVAGELIFRCGYAPDRIRFSQAGWMADNKKGHATDNEDLYDYSRISIGLKDNFIRSYLWKVNITHSKPSKRAIGRQLRGHSS